MSFASAIIPTYFTEKRANGVDFVALFLTKVTQIIACCNTIYRKVEPSLQEDFLIGLFKDNETVLTQHYSYPFFP